MTPPIASPSRSIRGIAHNRYNIPSPVVGPSYCSVTSFRPLVFVDKVRVRVWTSHPSVIRGRAKPDQLRGSPYKLSYRWINFPHGKVGICSSYLSSVTLWYNPSELDLGYNIFPNTDDVTGFLAGYVLPQLVRRVPELSLTRRDWILAKTGWAELGEIHLTADWEFPSREALEACFRNLKRSWIWRWNRWAYRRYATSHYINQTHWDIVFYLKDDEIAANHASWPEAVKGRSRNRLRIELRLRREELLRLGGRLKALHPELPLLRLGRLGDWDESLYGLAFDLYARRITSKHRDNADIRGADIPLYRFLQKYGGLPVYPRREKTSALQGADEAVVY